MPYKKGETGNPGGRRRSSATFQVRMLAQDYTQEAIERLAFWMRSQDSKASVQACQLLLERGWGKPTAAVEEEILLAKVKLLEQGQNPDSGQPFVVMLPDFSKPKDG